MGCHLAEALRGEFYLGLGAGGVTPGLPACLSCCKAVLCRAQPRVSLWGLGASYPDRAMVDNQQVPIPQSRVIGDTGVGEVDIIISSGFSQLTPGRW